MDKWDGWEVYVDEPRGSWGIREVPGEVWVLDFGCLPTAKFNDSNDMRILGQYIIDRAHYAMTEGAAPELGAIRRAFRLTPRGKDQ